MYLPDFFALKLVTADIDQELQVDVLPDVNASDDVLCDLEAWKQEWKCIIVLNSVTK